MSIHFNDSGNWDDIGEVYIKQNGSWISVNEVYFKQDGTWEFIFPVDTGLQPDIFWSLLDSRENPQNLEDGAIPIEFSAQFGPSALNVSLNWEVFSKNIVDYYNVYRSPSLSASFTKVNGNSTTTESYVDTVPESGTYYYEVTAVTNSGTETSPSDEVSVVVPKEINVNTLGATNITTDSAKISGEVTDIGSNITVSLSFEWGEQGNGLPNSRRLFDTFDDTTFSTTLLEEQQQLSSTISASDAGDLVRPVDWDPNTGRLAAGSNDDNLYIYDTNISLTNTISESSGDVRGVDWDKNSGRLAASSQNGPVFIYDSNLNKVDTLNDSSDIATGVEWDEGTGRLAVGSWDDTSYIYDSNLNLIQSLSSQPVDNIYDVGWDHKNGRFAMGGEANFLHLYDSNLSFIETKSFSGFVISIDWSINSGRLAVGTGEQNVYIYDSNLNQIKILDDSNQNVRGVSWDPLTDRLAVASNDNNGFIYDSNLNLVQTITDPSAEAVKVDWDENTNRLALSSGDTNTYIYETNGLLSPDTTYEYRAVGTYKDSLGVTEKGSIKSFTTNS